MNSIVYICIMFTSSVLGGMIPLHQNSVEDPLSGGQSCGASGYIQDAPIPEVMKHLRHKRAATMKPFRVWPQGRMPYIISNKFSNSGKRLIRKAMNHWQNETCISFVPRTNEPDYLYLYRGSGCCSYVGRRGGKQYLSLGLGCLRFGIITHELGHAVGFWHEQNRPDRSIYIDVIYDNVDTSKVLNFDPRKNNEVETFDQVYDYASIMHYGKRFFSKNGKKTIQTKSGYSYGAAKEKGNIQNNEIGKSYYKYDGPILSRQDILETNLLYKCTKISECGGTLFASSGSFTSINFPNEYPHDVTKDCIWIITTTKESKYNNIHTSLTLLVEQFNVGNSKSVTTGECEDDYVEVREGKGFLSPFIVRYCGRERPAPITTITGSLYVRFYISGKNVNKVKNIFTGFKASFKTDACSSSVVTFPNKIQTPQFPFPYQREKDCMWEIKGRKGMKIEIDFPFFSLRQLDEQKGCLDYIEIHEGDGNTEKFVGRFCGTNNPGKLNISTNIMKIHFHASKKKHVGWYMGFQANIRQTDINECASGTHDCSQVCLNYPGGYFCACKTGYKTVYQYNSRKAECLDKNECLVNNGGCSHQCVNTDGSYICSCPNGFTLNANKTTCVDVNECAFQHKPCSHICQNTIGGYECACEDGFVLQGNNRTCTVLPNCKGVYISSVGAIHSPTIPVTYQFKVKCIWNIKLPKNFQLSLSIDLPWGDNTDCHNYLLIYDNIQQQRRQINPRKICNQADVADDVIMNKHTAIVQYVGQAPFFPKFTVQYHSILPMDRTCGHIFNVSNGRFFTPGFPYKYPESQDCTWKIYSPSQKTLKIKFSHFSLESHKTCDFDYVDIEQHYLNIRAVKKIGRFCGNSKPENLYIDGSVSYLQIKFYSDTTMNDKGFKVHFKEIADIV